jgi:hypothetical protein
MFTKNLIFNGKMCLVIDANTFMYQPQQYLNTEMTVVEFSDIYDDTYNIRVQPFILPFRTSVDRQNNLPGIYLGNDSMNPFYEVLLPAYDMNGIIIDRQYSTDGMIDITNVNQMQELIECNNRFKEMEFSIMSSGNNIFTPRVRPDDTPEMAAFKQAICAKHIDIDKYKSRIGETYNNDKRLIQKGTITFTKLRSLCNALDLKATLILENAGDDVANPIPAPITVNITDGDASSATFIEVEGEEVSDEGYDDSEVENNDF